MRECSGAITREHLAKCCGGHSILVDYFVMWAGRFFCLLHDLCNKIYNSCFMLTFQSCNILSLIMNSCAFFFATYHSTQPTSQSVENWLFSLSSIYSLNVTLHRSSTPLISGVHKLPSWKLYFYMKEFRSWILIVTGEQSYYRLCNSLSSVLSLMSAAS